MRIRPVIYGLASIFVASAMLAVTAAFAAPLDDWRTVLSTHVNGLGQIDFDSLSEQPEPLERFVAYLADNGPTSNPAAFGERHAQLAFHLNAYNALAMHGVLDTGRPRDFSSVLKRARFFRWRKIVVDGRRMSLHTYENDVIRQYGDPRIHFALNCMVRDCPRLPRVPFTADQLDSQLEAAAAEFFSSDKYLKFDTQRRTVSVSSILDFYTRDFAPSGRPADLIPYINRYRDPNVPTDWRVTFLPYDWTVNRQ